MIFKNDRIFFYLIYIGIPLFLRLLQYFWHSNFDLCISIMNMHDIILDLLQGCLHCVYQACQWVLLAVSYKSCLCNGKLWACWILGKVMFDTGMEIDVCKLPGIITEVGWLFQKTVWLYFMLACIYDYNVGNILKDLNKNRFLGIKDFNSVHDGWLKWLKYNISAFCGRHLQCL